MNCSTDKASCKAKCFKIALMVVVGIGALGWVVMLLWNWLLPALFAGAQQVSYVQALGLLLLCKILFGGFRGGCHGHKLRQRWDSMSPEERQELKGRFKSRWCTADKGDGDTSNSDPARPE